MTVYEQRKIQLEREPKTWLVTGAAGFIGSNLVEELLRLGQTVVGLDDFSSGHQTNLDEVQREVGQAWSRFKMIAGDIRDAEICRRACANVDYVLHHAAIGSVPRSIAEPVVTHEVNVTAMLQLLLLAPKAGVRRFIYASSSAVYGDDATLPKVEGRLGSCLSPYAVSKLADELYAQVCGRIYGVETVGLRYFNIFGPRQDPNGAYAAVIPRWIAAMIHGRDVEIFGDGETTRDFCHVADVVQANILAATCPDKEVVSSRVFNIARHGSTTLNELYEILRSRLAPFHPHLVTARPVYRDFRPGDIRHSEASIAAAQTALGFAPIHTVASGLEAALAWYRANLGKAEAKPVAA
jgi:UDP-N-acetylglucosamine/UDP-N-acetylgalactosamine 4-epimerase